jgi:hypothetical protein
MGSIIAGQEPRLARQKIIRKARSHERLLRILLIPNQACGFDIRDAAQL